MNVNGHPATTPTMDSLEALEALLYISNSISNSNSTSNSGSAQGSQLSANPSDGNGASPNGFFPVPALNMSMSLNMNNMNNMNNPVSMPAWPSSVSFPTNFSPNSAFHSMALNVNPANNLSCISPRLSAPSSMPQTQTPPMAPIPSIMDAVLPNCFRPVSVSAVHAPAAANNTTTSGVNDDNNNNKNTINNKNSNSNRQQLQPSSQNFIRSSEVQAALNSKPQRGKKRDNLNILERQELTRTRNREHAKTTRIRKKQRYEELLNFEDSYKTLQKNLDLSCSRAKSVIKFIQARNAFFTSALSSSTTTVISDSSRDTPSQTVVDQVANLSNDLVTNISEQDNDQGSSWNYFSIDSCSTPNNEPAADESPSSECTELQQEQDKHDPPHSACNTSTSAELDRFESILHDTKSFKFISLDSPPISTNATKNCTFNYHNNNDPSTSSPNTSTTATTTGIEDLFAYDSNVINWTKQHIGRNHQPFSLQFEVVGGLDSIAISNDNSAFAHVELYFTTTENGSDTTSNKDTSNSNCNNSNSSRTELVARNFIRLEFFDASSDKLISIMTGPMSFVTDFYQSRCSSLRQGLAYPSAVSLGSNFS